MATPQRKQCSKCGEWFERNPKYGKKQWEAAKFCSRRCTQLGRYRTPPGAVRFICACGCGKPATLGRRYRHGHRGPKDFAYDAASRRWVVYGRGGTKVYWYRVVMEDKLGRPLRPGEVVHHINGDSTDDRPENLMVFASQGDHIRHHASQSRAGSRKAA